MRRKPRTLSSKQEALFSFLTNNRGKGISLAEIVNATGYKPASITNYIAKFDLGRFLQRKAGGGFIVVDATDLSPESLLVALTQSNAIRQIGWKCTNPLAKALVRKARDNMILALELYNRPSLENRLDAFSMLFCTAWEQILKAEIIETDGEPAIFRAQRVGKRRESISLDEACEKRFGKGDAVRENVARISELRHGATHLLMPEVQGVLSRLFQAGILNFSRRFLTIAGSPLLPPGASGLLSVVGDWSTPNGLSVRQLYGEQTGADIESLINEIGDSIDQSNDQNFAVSVKYSLVLTKSPGEADIKLSASPGGAHPALVVEKSVSAERTHPYTMRDLVRQVAQKCNVPVNNHDVQAAVTVEKWRNGDNEFHHYFAKLNRRTYSDKCAEELVKRINSDANYLSSVRTSYANLFKPQAASKVA